MPCWQHEAQLATLSNTWFLCDRCREAMRFAGDVAVALEHDTKASTSEGELADSLPEAGSGLAETLFVTPQSPPPGARPERDPAPFSGPVDVTLFEWKGEGFEEVGSYQIPASRVGLQSIGYLQDVDTGDEA